MTQTITTADSRGVHVVSRTPLYPDLALPVQKILRMIQAARELAAWLPDIEPGCWCPMCEFKRALREIGHDI